MKVKFTPLNIATAFFFVFAAYVFFYGAHVIGIAYGLPQTHLRITLSLIFLFLGFVVAFLDVMLRNFFPETKKLWIIELSFIALTVILFLLIK